MSKVFLATLFGAILVSGASFAMADEEGYNTSDGDSVTIGTDTGNGGEAAGDAEAVGSIQDQMQDSKDRWSGDAQRNAVENGQ